VLPVHDETDLTPRFTIFPELADLSGFFVLAFSAGLFFAWAKDDNRTTKAPGHREPAFQIRAGGDLAREFLSRLLFSAAWPTLQSFIHSVSQVGALGRFPWGPPFPAL
jgi:hypothetical protein